MKVVVNKDLCTGCGLCIDICSEVFEMGEDTVHVKVADASGELEGCCKEAAENCPVEAIKID